MHSLYPFVYYLNYFDITYNVRTQGEIRDEAIAVLSVTVSIAATRHSVLLHRQVTTSIHVQMKTFNRCAADLMIEYLAATGL